MLTDFKDKSIFEFEDYRELLKFLFEYNKAKNKSFSHRYFAKSAGFSTPNFLKLVMDGKSNLSLVSIDKFIKGFKLGKEEGRFFKHLVLFAQAKTSTDKQIHAREILRFREYRKLHPLSEAQYNFYSKWYFVPIRELVRLKGFKDDPEWIAKKIKGEVTTEQVRVALDELQKLGLLSRDSDGQLVQANQDMATSDEVVSSTIAQWHREMIRKAAESIDLISRNERDISSVTVAMSKSSMSRIKELISGFRRQILEVVANDLQCETVYQLNVQLFPLAEIEKGVENE